VANACLFKAEHVAAEGAEGTAGPEAKQAGSDDHELYAFRTCHVNHDIW
jgi:hypothetical protein